VPVHAHVLLLGWASLALAGVVYHLYPAAAGTRLARWHFWLHNGGLALFCANILRIGPAA
jgi:cbb3-type cytochrome oxidase subunit 1